MGVQGKANVVFFMVDQLSAKWLEAAMDGVCSLPNLSRLKSGGVSFSNAFSNNPVCCPARASIATGLTQPRSRSDVQWVSAQPRNTQLHEDLADGRLAHRRFWQGALPSVRFRGHAAGLPAAATGSVGHRGTLGPWVLLELDQGGDDAGHGDDRHHGPAEMGL